MSNVMQWPSRSVQHPPGCDCGCQDSRSGLFECWDQMSQFQQMVTDIVTKILTNNPQPLTGVTDGSDAKAGQVGEFITGKSTVSFAAYPTDTTTSVSLMVIAPGDWDLWAWMETSTPVGSAQFALSPVPAGLSNNMGGGGVPASVAATEEWLVNIGHAARGSFTVPTLLTFSVTVHQAINSALLAGTATLTVEARRRR